MSSAHRPPVANGYCAYITPQRALPWGDRSLKMVTMTVKHFAWPLCRQTLTFRGTGRSPRGGFSYSQFPDEETDAQRVKGLSRVAQLQGTLCPSVSSGRRPRHEAGEWSESPRPSPAGVPFAGSEAALCQTTDAAQVPLGSSRQGLANRQTAAAHGAQLGERKQRSLRKRECVRAGQ